jgi:hypothetical protein
VISLILRSQNSILDAGFEIFDYVPLMRRDPVNESLEFRSDLTLEAFALKNWGAIEK